MEMILVGRPHTQYRGGDRRQYASIAAIAGSHAGGIANCRNLCLSRKSTPVLSKKHPDAF
ncbi:MAG: hypothetical protein BGO16_01050 [Nitrobacter sp. 62-23]|nr:MAG: hypothetical protein BGO16_01050 [Nitrobacter sp. 62-23]